MTIGNLGQEQGTLLAVNLHHLPENIVADAGAIDVVRDAQVHDIAKLEVTGLDLLSSLAMASQVVAALLADAGQVDNVGCASRRVRDFDRGAIHAVVEPRILLWSGGSVRKVIGGAP